MCALRALTAISLRSRLETRSAVGFLFFPSFMWTILPSIPHPFPLRPKSDPFEVNLFVHSFCACILRVCAREELLDCAGLFVTNGSKRQQKIASICACSLVWHYLFQVAAPSSSCCCCRAVVSTDPPDADFFCAIFFSFSLARCSGRDASTMAPAIYFFASQ